ncbi:glycosyltransferase [Catenulispora subtropica]|uniref:glycosyltransferase n=1 Tax=Catenulispora subtropica TaxID=450798 RepID=UPI0031DA73A2
MHAAPDLELLVCAVDHQGLRYGGEVAAVLKQDDRAAYPKTAAGLAAAGVDAVLIQHEFGIYGGPDGAWITSFAAELASAGVPYLVTLHTVPGTPSRAQTGVLQQLCRRAAAVTVFTPTARRLAAAAGIGVDHFATIPHGAPATLRSPRHRARAAIRPEVAAALETVENATVVSTFGLVSVNKGLETAIAAVCDLARDLPDLRYLIAGATHPEVVHRHGEGYRQSLRELVEELGATDRIQFLDFYLTEAEVAAVLARSTAFLTPYRSRDQISSGALTYALAAGCPVVSTSFFYAQDMLAGGAGLLAEPGDAQAYTEALRRMLTDHGHRSLAADAAWAAGAELVWPVVARQIADAIRAAAADEARQSSPVVVPYQR